ncbi:diguanylate cyclase domain-containing protein [Thaumasiovibrio sp. DFM-14]|uniref:sensor domain-containing diguanylate cyclase n=1 Tax=Thaumasiovibrio sp. DFM-14 TaxID=3384792 RepID=UPI0039A3D260
MMWFPRSIKHRLTVSVLLVTTLFLTTALSIQYWSEYNDEYKEIETQIDAQLSTILLPLSEALWDLDFAQLESLLQGFYAAPFVCHVELVGRDGTRVAMQTCQNMRDSLVSYPLYFGSRELGVVKFAIDDIAIKASIRSKLMMATFIHAGTIAIIITMVLLLTKTIVTTPLTRLHQSVSRFDRGGVNKIAIPASLLDKQDEITHLAKAIIQLQQQARNAIAKQLYVERALRQHQNQLQRTIDERTDVIWRQSKVNKLLADMSLDMLSQQGKGANSIISRAMAPLSNYLALDRISMLDINNGHAVFRHSWWSEQTHVPSLDGFFLGDMTYLRRRLRSLEPIVIDDVETLKVSAKPEYQLVTSIGIHSVAAFPLIDGDDVVGLLAIAKMEPNAGWDEDVISAITRFASAISELQIQNKNRQAMTTLQEKLISANERLQVIAETDELTGLVNRRPFKRELEQTLEPQRFEHTTMVMLMIDIDHFKKYNDIYGHVQGDIALRYVARALSQTMSPNGYSVARIGGEEFAVLMVDVVAREAEVLGERLCESIRALRIPHEGNSDHQFLTISVGGAVVELTKTSTLQAGDVMEVADAALYEAKRNGRNQFVMHELDYN